MGIPYSEVYENGLMSQEILDHIIDQCECGEEVHFTESLTQIFCPNRFCTYKVAARLEAMAKAMQVDGFGESTCQELCRQFNLKSPYQVFLLKDKTCPSVAAFEKKIAEITSPDKTKVKLWELVKLAGIPNIESIAYKIFDGYDSLEEAYAEIEKHQVPFIAEKLGLKNATTGVMAANVYKNLIEYKSELLFGESKFTIYKPTGDTFYIAITGGVSGFPNKSEYVRYINTRYSGKINVMQMNAVTHQVNALVADGDTSSKKYKTACRLKEKGSDILITDSVGLLKWLDENYLGD